MYMECVCRENTHENQCSDSLVCSLFLYKCIDLFTSVGSPSANSLLSYTLDYSLQLHTHTLSLSHPLKLSMCRFLFLSLSFIPFAFPHPSNLALIYTCEPASFNITFDLHSKTYQHDCELPMETTTISIKIWSILPLWYVLNNIVQLNIRLIVVVVVVVVAMTSESFNTCYINIR